MEPYVGQPVIIKATGLKTVIKAVYGNGEVEIEFYPYNRSTNVRNLTPVSA